MHATVDAMRDALRAYLRFRFATHIEWAPELTIGDTTVSYAPQAVLAPIKRVDRLDDRGSSSFACANLRSLEVLPKRGIAYPPETLYLPLRSISSIR
jgi:hypothetical protein